MIKHLSDNGVEDIIILTRSFRLKSLVDFAYNTFPATRSNLEPVGSLVYVIKIPTRFGNLLKGPTYVLASLVIAILDVISMIEVEKYIRVEWLPTRIYKKAVEFAIQRVLKKMISQMSISGFVLLGK
ncbi:unnamed protein product [Amaranthus hypochondriacus]